MTSQSTKQPVHKIAFGNVRVAVWENLNRDNQVFHTFDLERSYVDQNGQWHNQKLSLKRNEIFKVISALNQAYADYYSLPQFRPAPDPSPVASEDRVA